MPIKQKLHFTMEKETKGAVRFQEVNAEGGKADPYVIGTLYIRKTALNGAVPQTLKVTVEG